MAGAVPDAAASSGDETVQALGLPNEAFVEGRIYVGGPPDAQVLERAREASVGRVINLQTASEPGVSEEKAQVEALGMTYVSIPIEGPAGLTEANARAVHEALQSEPKKAIVHCASGNRAGAMMALRAFYALEMTRADALAAGKTAGLRGLEHAVVEHFDQACAALGESPQC
jgi:protein tyrosine phosphatase (PTP) superfamily phosphohydrolase (DUF442 family)